MAASWRRNEGREDGRRTRKGPQRRALSRLFKPGGEAQARGLPKGGWGCLGFRALEEAGGYSLCGFVLPPPPPTIPPSFWPPPPPNCPYAVLLPGSGVGSFPAALARGAVARRAVLVSGGPGISAEAMAGKEAARERQKEQFTEKHAHSLSLEAFEIKGL